MCLPKPSLFTGSAVVSFFSGVALPYTRPGAVPFLSWLEILSLVLKADWAFAVIPVRTMAKMIR
ncbi:hypothetical protein D3C86_2225890 [compost metagenome]